MSESFYQPEPKQHTFLPRLFRKSQATPAVARPKSTNDSVSVDQKLQIIRGQIELTEPETVQRTENNVLEAVSLFSNIDRTYFLTGGVALALQTDGIKRRHGDLGLEMFEEDREHIETQLLAKGYVRKKDNLADNESHNKETRTARFYKGRIDAKGPDGNIDIFYIRKDESNPLLVHNAMYDMPIPKALYDESEPVTLKGVAVPIVPRSLLMLYKMYMGGLELTEKYKKDTHDLGIVQNRLTPAEVETIDQLWERTHIYMPGWANERFQVNRQ